MLRTEYPMLYFPGPTLGDILMAVMTAPPVHHRLLQTGSGLPAAKGPEVSPG